MPPKHPIEKVTTWIGSVPSLIIHSLVFLSFFFLSVLHITPWALMLLILTTALSLEAIYLAIFIQMTVNRQAHELAGVSEDVEDIQEDIDEIQGDVEDIQENIEEISEDELEEQRKHAQAVTLESMTKDIQRLLNDLEELKREQKP